MPKHSQAIPSRRNNDSWINVPSWVPRKTHASLAPQAQARPTYFTPVTGSRSPSKLGLLAPTLEARPQCGAKTSTYPHLQSVGPERARAHDKRVISLPALISKYVLGIINLWLDQGPWNEWSLMTRTRKQCNPIMPRGCGHNTHQYPYPIPARSPFPFHHFIMNVTMIVITI
jgi:hypothetical protein